MCNIIVHIIVHGGIYNNVNDVRDASPLLCVGKIELLFSFFLLIHQFVDSLPGGQPCFRFSNAKGLQLTLQIVNFNVVKVWHK